jgi:lipopolysaccharide export LptBFGC system permease protein LptF
MKIKLMIALVILALVFGMVLIACDDGELPKIKEGTNETIIDIYLLGDGVDSNGNLLNPKTDTTLINIEDLLP